MPRIEAIIRTAEQRLRPVLLTTSTTIAGLTPMMLGISLDFFGGGYSIDSPTALWWKQLATAVVFGLGTATVLTLVVTPALLALRIWFWDGAYASARRLGALTFGRQSRLAQDVALTRAARQVRSPELVWMPEDLAAAEPAPPVSDQPGDAAEKPVSMELVDADAAPEPTNPAPVGPPMKAAE
jgi:multidrug efflux pump